MNAKIDYDDKIERNEKSDRIEGVISEEANKLSMVK